MSGDADPPGAVRGQPVASGDFRARDVDCRCPAGLSVAELLELALIDTPAKPWHGFVTWVDGVPVPDINTFNAIMAGCVPKQEIKLEVQRGDKLVSVSLTLEKLPEKKKD